MASPKRWYSGVSMIWCRETAARGAPPTTRRRAAADEAAAAAQPEPGRVRPERRPARGSRQHAAPRRAPPRRWSRREQREGDEGEEPGEVEVEPVGRGRARSRQQEGRQRGQLERRLATRVEAHGDRGTRSRIFSTGLRQREVGIARVLGPVPDRERRVTAELEIERPVPEDTRRVERIRLEQENPEGERSGQ